MSDYFIFWIALAVTLFWSVGAYNRLVRLRSLAIGAFPVIENQFRQYVTLVHANFPDKTPQVEGTQDPTRSELILAWAALVGAAEQFEASLRVARVRPLDASTMCALALAHQTLLTSWVKLKEAPHDLAGAVLPETLQLQWERISQLADNVKLEFNRHVNDYNRAIAQFPASLLARLFGFTPAELI